uniref:Uncharacterized protein n=1 Tax=Cacopsylla melanoneura TaxID=428564 RepID=A0A8D8Z5E7_9HEMI
MKLLCRTLYYRLGSGSQNYGPYQRECHQQSKVGGSQSYGLYQKECHQQSKISSGNISKRWNPTSTQTKKRTKKPARSVRMFASVRTRRSHNRFPVRMDCRMKE